MSVIWFFCCLFMLIVAGQLDDKGARAVGYLSALCFFVAFASALIASAM